MREAGSAGGARWLGVVLVAAVLPAVVAGLAPVAQAATDGAAAVPAAPAVGTCPVTWKLSTSFHDPVIYGDEADQISVTLTGCNQAKNPNPTGNVTLTASSSAGTLPPCTITLSPFLKSAASHGTCTPAATALPAWTASGGGGAPSWTLRASYPGDANDAASTDSISNWETFNQASTSVTLTVSQPT